MNLLTATQESFWATCVAVLFMSYIVIGRLTYSTQTNRNTALNAINNTLANFTYQGVDTSLPAGVTTSGTTIITISIQVNDADVDTIRMALLSSWTIAARATTGHYIGVVKV